MIVVPPSTAFGFLIKAIDDWRSIRRRTRRTRNELQSTIDADADTLVEFPLFHVVHAVRHHAQGLILIERILRGCLYQERDPAFWQPRHVLKDLSGLEGNLTMEDVVYSARYQGFTRIDHYLILDGQPELMGGYPIYPFVEDLRVLRSIFRRPRRLSFRFDNRTVTLTISVETDSEYVHKNDDHIFLRFSSIDGY